MVIFHSYVSLPEGNDYIMGLMSLMIGHASTNWFLLVSYDLNVTVMPSLAWKVGSSTGSFHFEPENRWKPIEMPWFEAENPRNAGFPTERRRSQRRVWKCQASTSRWNARANLPGKPGKEADCDPVDPRIGIWLEPKKDGYLRLFRGNWGNWGFRASILGGRSLGRSQIYVLQCMIPV